MIYIKKYVLIYVNLLYFASFMKINKLDLAKIISDFMFLWVNNPEEKAKVIFKIKHKLTAHWFEKYIQYYFQVIKWYKVKLNWNTNDFDWWIDLKWIKSINWEKYYLVAQCKKYSIKDITEENIRSFHWWSFYKYSEYKNNTETYYITTSKFTYNAKKFAKEVWIKAVDFLDIYNLQKVYSIEQFWEELIKKEWKNQYNKSFNQEQINLDIYDQTYNSTWISDKDVFQLLKQIRRDYSYSKQLRLWDIARNDTLELLARERPQNLQALKQTISNLSTREKNKLLRHWNIFVERLKYIHNEEENETEIDKWFFSKLVEFLR